MVVRPKVVLGRYFRTFDRRMQFIGLRPHLVLAKKYPVQSLLLLVKFCLPLLVQLLLLLTTALQFLLYLLQVCMSYILLVGILL